MDLHPDTIDRLNAADYPAAHSMDSEWFAVDADGHVAVFETGEAGICPTNASVRQDFSVIEEMVAAGFSINVDEILAREPWVYDKTSSQWLGSVWLEAANATVDIKKELHGDAVKIPHATISLWHAGYAHPQKIYALQRQDKVKRAWDSEQLKYSDFGIYTYGYDDYTFGEPYILAEAPSKPVTVDQLPPALAETFRSVTFSDLKFGEPEIYPRRYFRCFGWGEEE